MTFNIYIQQNSTRYKMAVTRTVETALIEEYTIVAGEKKIVFRNNRPEMRRLERRGRVKWQLVSKNFTVEEKDIQKAAAFFLEIQDRIEDKIEPPPSFQQTRNKK